VKSQVKSKRVAVIGGGISGLAAAHRLQESDADLDVQLFEAATRPGGVLQTEKHEDLLIERSADMFTTREPWALDLCRRIGFDDQLINTNEADRRAFVVRSGRLIPVPQGFALMSPTKLTAVLTTPLLSPLGKLRFLLEIFVRQRRETEDESLRDFSVRRFGKETFDRLIQPLVGGIYTADPEKLSMQAALSQFVAMESEHGSLIRAARKGRGQQQKAAGELSSGARYGQFVAPREGMGSLITALLNKLERTRIHVESPVDQLVRREQQWCLTSKGNQQTFDAVIVALPACRAAPLLSEADAQLSQLLDRITYASAAVVVLAYHRAEIQRMVQGFGFVVPAAENRRILAGSFSSIKFPHRAPNDRLLARVFMGGALQSKLLEQDDAELTGIAVDELQDLLEIAGQPYFSKVIRWNHAMPQYHLGHQELVARIRECESQMEGFAITGNAYSGVGIPMCIGNGERAAEQILRQLGDRVV